MTDGIKWEYNGVEFKVGDRVKVMRWPEDRNGAMGPGTVWENIWIPERMDAIIPLCHAGVDFEIHDIAIEGVEFTPLVDCDSELVDYRYPLSSLELVQ